MRLITSFLLLLTITSCSGIQKSSYDNQNIIPEEKISSKSVEPTIIDDGKFNIALILPLNQNKEHSLINAAQLALVESNNSNINLITFDSSLIENDPHSLLTKLTERNIKAIVGPLHGAETDKLNSLLMDKHIPILSLSNDSSIQGDYLLTMGVSPDSQANILVRYAISQGFNNFYILLPATKYGKLIENAITDIVTSKESINYHISWYSGENVDQVMEEFIHSIKDKDNKNSIIFMPQGGKNISKLNNLLNNNGVYLRLMGSQAWENRNILNLEKFEKAILLKSYIEDHKFYHDFYKFYHKKPTNLDFITYTATLLIANMEKNNLQINKTSIITHNQEFGKYADVKFNDQGLSLYKLSIVEVENGKLKRRTSHP